SAPVLVSMLLVANRKCGLSASAAEAPITTAANAEISTNRMRRIDFPLMRSLELHWSRSARQPPPHRRCRTVHAEARPALTGPQETALTPRCPGPARVIPPLAAGSGTAQCGIWHQHPP